MFVLIANPNPTTAATVRATYLLPDGSTLTKDYTVAPSSRFTISVDNETFNGQRLLAYHVALDDSAVDQQRAGGGRALDVVAGRLERAVVRRRTTRRARRRRARRGRWPMANRAARQARRPTCWWPTPGAATASVRVTVYVEGGGTAVRTYAVAGNSRFSIDVAGAFGATVIDHRYGALVESLGATPAPVVVERAMYTNAGGRFWAAGTNALATKIR